VTVGFKLAACRTTGTSFVVQADEMYPDGSCRRTKPLESRLKGSVAALSIFRILDCSSRFRGDSRTGRAGGAWSVAAVVDRLGTVSSRS
jgi:hypothetical protein